MTSLAGAGRWSLHRRLPTLDSVLDAHGHVLGGDFDGYRHHTYRVFNLCAAVRADEAGDTLEKIATAAAFHDLGIWTDGTFDYLAPSIRLAEAHLTATGRGAWVDEVRQMIL